MILLLVKQSSSFIVMILDPTACASRIGRKNTSYKMRHGMRRYIHRAKWTCNANLRLYNAMSRRAASLGVNMKLVRYSSACKQ